MDIHKPKPWHGWPEFVKEIGTIVIGVLIALGAEQAVEWMHWRHEAEAARDVFRRDNLRLMQAIGHSDTLSPCVDRRLNELQDILDKAETSGKLPAIGDIGAYPGIGWFMRGWEGATSSGVMPHLARGEGARYAAMHAYLVNVGLARDDATVQWATLNSMTGAERKLSEAEAADLRKALNGARAAATKQRLLADLAGRMVLDTHLNSGAEVLAAWRAGGAQAPSDVCRPIGPWPGLRSASALAAAPAPPAGSYDDQTSAFHDMVEK